MKKNCNLKTLVIIANCCRFLIPAMPKMFIHSVIFSKCYILDRFVEGILGRSRECTLDGALVHHTPVHTLVHTWGNIE